MRVRILAVHCCRRVSRNADSVRQNEQKSPTKPAGRRVRFLAQPWNVARLRARILLACACCRFAPAAACRSVRVDLNVREPGASRDERCGPFGLGGREGPGLLRPCKFESAPANAQSRPAGTRFSMGRCHSAPTHQELQLEFACGLRARIDVRSPVNDLIHARKSKASTQMVSGFPEAALTVDPA